MTDCHYYFDDYDFTDKELGMVYTVGNRFMRVPGKYQLPFFEGTYRLSSD